MRWAALLSGVNVGGNRKLPMADLRAVIAGLGWRDVGTLLASGNVVFECDEADEAVVVALIEAALGTIGLKTNVMVRELAAIEAIIVANPFRDATEVRPQHLLVHFHRDAFPAVLLDRVPAVYDGPERLHAIGRELFVDYPAGIGDSRLHMATAKLGFPNVATARNWNTVLKLAALLAG
ncbi:MAG: DUF1697 domain-containing protein [Sphingomonas sp.]|nr:DUF1697 domain-containing protein [Sphingomonas sp.]